MFDPDSGSVNAPGPHVAGDEPGQIGLLLLSAAVAGEQAAAEHGAAEEERTAFHAAAALGDPLHRDRQVEQALAAAAELLGQRDPEHAVLGE